MYSVLARLLRYEVASILADLMPTATKLFDAVSVSVWCYQANERAYDKGGESSAKRRKARGTGVHMDNYVEGLAGHIDLVADAGRPLFVPIRHSSRTTSLSDDIGRGMEGDVAVVPLSRPHHSRPVVAYIAVRTSELDETARQRWRDPSTRRAFLRTLVSEIGAQRHEVEAQAEHRPRLQSGEQARMVFDAPSTAHQKAAHALLCGIMDRPSQVRQHGIGMALAFVRSEDGRHVERVDGPCNDRFVLSRLVRLLQRSIFDGSVAHDGLSIRQLVKRVSADERRSGIHLFEPAPRANLGPHQPSGAYGALKIYDWGTGYIRVPVCDRDNKVHIVIHVGLRQPDLKTEHATATQGVAPIGLEKALWKFADDLRPLGDVLSQVTSQHRSALGEETTRDAAELLLHALVSPDRNFVDDLVAMLGRLKIVGLDTNTLASLHEGDRPDQRSPRGRLADVLRHLEPSHVSTWVAGSSYAIAVRDTDRPGPLPEPRPRAQAAGLQRKQECIWVPDAPHATAAGAEMDPVLLECRMRRHARPLLRFVDWWVSQDAREVSTLRIHVSPFPPDGPDTASADSDEGFSWVSTAGGHHSFSAAFHTGAVKYEAITRVKRDDHCWLVFWKRPHGSHPQAAPPAIDASMEHGDRDDEAVGIVAKLEGRQDDRDVRWPFDHVACVRLRKRAPEEFDVVGAASWSAQSFAAHALETERAFRAHQDERLNGSDHRSTVLAAETGSERSQPDLPQVEAVVPMHLVRDHGALRPWFIRLHQVATGRLNVDDLNNADLGFAREFLEHVHGYDPYGEHHDDATLVSWARPFVLVAAEILRGDRRHISTFPGHLDVGEDSQCLGFSSLAGEAFILPLRHDDEVVGTLVVLGSEARKPERAAERASADGVFVLGTTNDPPSAACQWVRSSVQRSWSVGAAYPPTNAPTSARGRVPAVAPKFTGIGKDNEFYLYGEIVPGATNGVLAGKMVDAFVEAWRKERRPVRVSLDELIDAGAVNNHAGRAAERLRPQRDALRTKLENWNGWGKPAIVSSMLEELNDLVTNIVDIPDELKDTLRKKLTRVGSTSDQSTLASELGMVLFHGLRTSPGTTLLILPGTPAGDRVGA